MGGSIVAETIKSCGCKTKELYLETMNDRYSENNTRRIHNPREAWQIKTLNNAELLRCYIVNLTIELNKIPTILDLASRLNVGRGPIKNRLIEYELLDLVQYSDKGTSSEEELLLYNYIKPLCDQMGYTVIQGDRKILGGQEIDIFISELNLGIEYNGSYWHSDKFKSSNSHIDKTLLCNSKGVRLIHIFDYEYKTDYDIDKINRYLKDLICGCEVIYSDNCRIKILENSEIKDFVNTYNLQGHIDSDINIGLYHDQEIIASISFNKIDENCEYEITRICNKSGIEISDGLDSVYKFFIKSYKPRRVLAKCNLSKFTGEIYTKLGMRLISKAEPRYIWYHHSRGLLDDIDSVDNKTIHDLNYNKVYDCGYNLYEDIL